MNKNDGVQEQDNIIAATPPQTGWLLNPDVAITNTKNGYRHLKYSVLLGIIFFVISSILLP
jgi:hypothetical protein